IPGMTEASLLPEAAAAAGIGYAALFARVIVLFPPLPGHGGGGGGKKRLPRRFLPEKPPRAHPGRSNFRRRGGQPSLSVKNGSRRATQHRIRSAMGVMWKLAVFVILCAAGYAGAREAVRRLFFENPDYHVQTIELQTDGTLQREQVLKAADLHEGANIFSVN